MYLYLLPLQREHLSIPFLSQNTRDSPDFQVRKAPWMLAIQAQRDTVRQSGDDPGLSWWTEGVNESTQGFLEPAFAKPVGSSRVTMTRLVGCTAMLDARRGVHGSQKESHFTVALIVQSWGGGWRDTDPSCQLLGRA